MSSHDWNINLNAEKNDTEEMTRLSQIPILDREEWSLSEAIDGEVSVSGVGNDELDINPTKGSG